MRASPALFADSVPGKAIGSSSFSKVVESYLQYYASGHSHTARAKRLDLQHFLEFLCAFRGCSSVAKLTVSDWDASAVQRFVDEALRQGESPATVARRLATIKHMGRTLAEKVPGFINPAKEVKTPRLPVIRPQALQVQEIKKIETRAVERLGEKQSFIRLRNKTLFNFLLDTGIRADEVRLLRLGQLDDELSWIKNVRTKGRRYRNVYITSAMRPELREYLAARELQLKRFYPRLSKKDNSKLPLFISTYNAKAAEPDSFLMGAKSIWRAINELSADVPLHPHLLRHSYAIDLLDNSNDVRLVAQALGHSDVRITMRYTERRNEEVAEALERSRRKGELK